MSNHVWPENREGHVIRIVARRLGRVFDDAYPAPYEDTLTLTPDRLKSVLAFLRVDPDTDLGQLVDLSCVDRGEAASPRFEVVYRLRSSRLGYRLTLIVHPDDLEPTVPSIVDLYPAANWFERELWEMFAVYPDGHPDLRPLLLYEDFSGAAGRRDYPGDKDQPLVPRQTGHEVKIIGDPAGPIEPEADDA